MKKLLALVAILSLTACPHPIPGQPTPPGIIDCGLKSVRDHGLGLIPRVNTCLTSMNWVACLISLIDPVAGITEDVLACVTQSSGAGYSMAAQANPGDVTSVQAADHARQFLTERGYKFAPAKAP